MEVLERPDMQGLILRAYHELRDARYYLLEIGDVRAFQHWLAERLLRRQVTTAADGAADYKQGALNLAFTVTGLQKLGIDLEPSGYDSFGLEFREGLTHPSRSRFLGDIGDNDPDNWSWGGRRGPRSHHHIDCVCLTFADDSHGADRQRRHLADVWERVRPNAEAAAVVHELDAYLSLHGKEHFGFRDGISQPIIRFTKRDDEIPVADRPFHLVEPGEFILGYENENRRMPVTPAVTAARDHGNRLGALARRSRWRRRSKLSDLRDFGRNGTYVVLRQLYQDVERFHQFLETAGGPDSRSQQLLAARIVGRWPNGTPLVVSPAESAHIPDEALNRFGYFAEDRFGLRCPLGAHIRRGNPRDSTAAGDGQVHALKRVNFHRLLRRGRLYGPPFPTNEPQHPDYRADRGLLFLCLNADLRRQFEFVQQTWLNSHKFGGLFDEGDPLVGGNGAFTVQGAEGHQRISGLRRFVTVKGGGYFFMPGISALQCLADPA
jgi:deferrochelatase/peroxidase EfeB